MLSEDFKQLWLGTVINILQAIVLVYYFTLVRWQTLYLWWAHVGGGGMVGLGVVVFAIKVSIADSFNKKTLKIFKSW